MSEKLALEQRLAERRAVQPHEGRLRPRRRQVNRLGDELLARPALARDEHTRLARAHLRDEVQHRLHLRVARHDVAEGVAFAEPVAQPLRLLQQLRLLHRALDDRAERPGVQRLEEVVLRPLSHRVHGARDGAERRHHDEHRPRSRRPRLLHERDSVQAGHLEVREDYIGAELLQLPESLEPVGGRLGRVALFVENLAQRRAGVRLVVDDEDPALARGHESRSTKLQRCRENARTGVRRLSWKRPNPPENARPCALVARRASSPLHCLCSPPSRYRPPRWRRARSARSKSRRRRVAPPVGR